MEGFKNIIILAWIFSVSCPVTSFKILLLVNNLKSHMMYFSKLGNTLASRGHHVTVVAGQGTEVSVELPFQDGLNYTSYNVKGELLAEKRTFKLQILSLAYETSILKTLDGIKHLVEQIEQEHGQILDDERLLENLQGQRFDFIVSDQMDPYFLVAYSLGAPMATMAIECMWYEYRMPYIPSYVPSLFGGLSDRMNFMERVGNVLFYLMTTPAFFPRGGHDKSAKYAPGKEVMGYAEMNSRASLCLRLREPVTDTPRGFTPNIINVGSLLLRPLGEIPAVLRQFVDEAEHGVIILSFGSWLDVWPDYLADIFIDTFSQLPQRVLWKYKGTLSKKPPDNVRVTDWIPQNEILAHQNTRLFLTHCGIGSFHEAVYHGVPLIGFPMAIDQKSNAAIIKTRHYGLILDLATFAVSDLKEAIATISNNATYTESIRAASSILKERPPGDEIAAYWIEHVIRHGDLHLRPKAFEMPWYQYLGLDVMLFFLVVFATVVVVLVSCCRCVCRCFIASKSRTESKNKCE